MRRRSCWAALATAVLTACSGPLSCSAVGCISGVSIFLTGFPSSVTGPVHVRACAGGTCVDQDDPLLPPDVLITLAGPPAPGTAATATVRITRAGAVLLDAGTPVTLRRRAPNGEQCGPICWFAHLTATPGGLSTA